MAGLFEQKFVRLIGGILGVADTANCRGGHADTRHGFVDVTQWPRALKSNDRRKDRAAFRQPLCVESADEGFESLGVKADLQL